MIEEPCALQLQGLSVCIPREFEDHVILKESGESFAIDIDAWHAKHLAQRYVVVSGREFLGKLVIGVYGVGVRIRYIHTVHSTGEQSKHSAHPPSMNDLRLRNRHIGH